MLAGVSTGFGVPTTTIWTNTRQNCCCLPTKTGADASQHSIHPNVVASCLHCHEPNKTVTTRYKKCPCLASLAATLANGSKFYGRKRISLCQLSPKKAEIKEKRSIPIGEQRSPKSFPRNASEDRESTGNHSGWDARQGRSPRQARST